MTCTAINHTGVRCYLFCKIGSQYRISADLSTAADTDTMSITASDMYLMRQAQRVPQASKEHGLGPFRPPTPSAGGRANGRFRVNYSWQRGPTFSVLTSRRPTEPAAPSVLGVGIDNSRVAKDVFTFRGSETDLSGKK